MKKILSYTVKNKLGELIKREQAKRVLGGSEKVLLSDIEEELATHCNLTRDGILRSKRGLSIPSLPVAFKMAEFFEVSIAELFALTDKKGAEEMELV
jgi:DNA-binding XRE family transcriptional regulator